MQIQNTVYRCLPLQLYLLSEPSPSSHCLHCLKQLPLSKYKCMSASKKYKYVTKIIPMHLHVATLDLLGILK